MRARTRTHTHAHPLLCISFSQERIKRQRCPFAYHENMKQPLRSIDFCAHPPDISVCSMNILCSIQVLNGQCCIQFRLTMPVQQTDLKLWLVSFCKPVPSLVLCSQQSPSYKSAHSLTICNIFWHAALSLCHHHSLSWWLTLLGKTFSTHKNWITQ